MKNKSSIHWHLLLLVMVMVLVIPGTCLCASSVNYQVKESIGQGGGEITSPTYRVFSTHGQTIEGGNMQTASYIVSSGFVASALPTIEADIDIAPDTLNLKSDGKWITCYITLSEDYSQDLFNPSKVALTKVDENPLHPLIYGEWGKPQDSILMVKFSRSSVQAFVQAGDHVELTVAGVLENGITFQGADSIRVINKGKKQKNLN